jgi:hypothetical protein
MIEVKSLWAHVADRPRWAVRGAAFIAKVKATKAIWLPPRPSATAQKSVATAKKAAKKTTRKTTKKVGGKGAGTTTKASRRSA